MSEVRGITIRQPYAWAVAAGHKRVENRTLFTSWRGLLLIHAANVWHAEGSADMTVARVWGPAMGLNGPVHPVPNPDYFHRGVLAVARLAGVHEATDGCCEPWGHHVDPPGPCAPGRELHPAPRPLAHWDLADVRRLTEPVPTKGKLGLWRPDPELMRLVRARLP